MPVSSIWCRRRLTASVYGEILNSRYRPPGLYRGHKWYMSVMSIPDLMKADLPENCTSHT